VTRFQPVVFSFLSPV